MKKCKYVLLGVLLAGQLSPLNVIVRADEHTTLPTTDVVFNADNVSLEIPDEANVILRDDETSVAYVVNEAVSLQNEFGEELVAPAVVETEILSNEGGEVEGVTEYIINISEAVEKDNSETDLQTTFKDIVQSLAIGERVSASTLSHTSQTGAWDNTYSVKLNLTVHWKRINGSRGQITSVSGHYHIADMQARVVSSEVFVGQGDWANAHQRTFYLGASNYWHRNTGFPAVPYQGWISRFYVKYSATLERGGSRWSVVTDMTL